MLYGSIMDKIILTTKETASYIGCATHTLKKSRYTGILFGVEAPPFVSMGREIRYKKQSIDDWISQFEEKLNTSS